MACMPKPFNGGIFSNSSSHIFRFRRHFHSSNSTTFHCTSISMCSNTVPPLPENRIIVGCGMTAVDFLATVDGYPKPDDKVRTTSFKVQGGGNAGNALTCAARLGLKPKLISKVADDAQGKSILEELEADGVDTSFIVASKGGSSTFSYVLVDSQTTSQPPCVMYTDSVILLFPYHTMAIISGSIDFRNAVIIPGKTRTSIYTPGDPPLMPDDLSQSMLLSAFDEARLVYFDGMSIETALFVAQEAARNNIPILVEAESPRDGLDELLKLADFAVCSARFPQAWTQAPSTPTALVSMLLKLPNIKFVIVTLGEDGCLMLERSANEDADIVESNVESFLEFLYKGIDDSLANPTCRSSAVTKFRANGIGTICGRLFIGTAERIPDSELIDTTGAGDAFIGAIMYAICANMAPEIMLPFAAQVAAAKCRALGARTGLPLRTDPRLTSFLC